ncbi:D-methionine transport system ATP-binding protein [Streptococcus pseudoporcinus]|uniref:D-methionine transport system ATP-binding protein n=1 Tax=Streptococcus pseudoporcinus TaxID=361101 RepID=A0A4V6L6K9_9STRE|nr:D-methionine transport system ATP-binding protein [Streptococcus pseudoporcinus]
MNQIYRDYEVTANILYGNIEILDQTPVGEMILVLEGDAKNLALAEDALAKAGVDVTILKRGN